VALAILEVYELYLQARVVISYPILVVSRLSSPFSRGWYLPLNKLMKYIEKILNVKFKKYI